MKHRNRNFQRVAVADRRASVHPTIAASTDARLVQVVRETLATKYPDYEQRKRSGLCLAEITRRFRVRNEIGLSLFKTAHWQTMFKIEYPGVL